MRAVRTALYLLIPFLLGCEKLTERPEEGCFIPYIDFVAQQVNPATLEVQFSSVVSTNGRVSTHRWDFGDGTTYTGEVPPVHRYPKQNGGGPATYRVTYIVTNECGEARWTRDVNISPCLATVRYTWRFLNDSTVEFTNRITSPSPVSVEWDFGDGTKSTSTAATITKKYEFAGNYKVLLKATNNCGENFYLDSVSVCPPAAPEMTVQQAGCATVSLDASGTRGGGRYQWDFGNGVVLPAVPSADPRITYSFPAPGTYQIKLSVINSAGCDTATLVKPVTITGLPLVPNEAFTFTANDLTLDFSRAPVTNATSYTWDYGDGTTAQGLDPAPKTYARPGVYNVTLTATGPCNEQKFTRSIPVPYYKNLPAPPEKMWQVVALSAREIYYFGIDGGLYVTDTAGRWSGDLGQPAGLVGDANMRLYRDRNNRMWMYGKGQVARFEPESRTWDLEFDRTGLKRNAPIDDIAIDDAGNLWTLSDGELRRNREEIEYDGNARFTSIAFAPGTGRLWLTTSNRGTLYYVDRGDDEVESAPLSGIPTGGDDLEVHPNGDLFFATSIGIARTDSRGTLKGLYTSAQTGGVLTGTPRTFRLEGANIWAIQNGRLVKVPIDDPGRSLNYSINADLNGLSWLDIIFLGGGNIDLALAKGNENAAIHVY